MRTFAIGGRIIQQLIRDKRTLALMLLAPLLILTLVYFLFQTNADNIATVGGASIPESLVNRLEEADIKVVEYVNSKDIKERIIEDELDAFLVWDGSKLFVTYDATATTTVGAIKAKLRGIQQQGFMIEVKEVLGKTAEGGALQPGDIPTPFEVDETYVHGSEDTTYFDTISPFLIGFFVFFFVFLISGISLLRERTTGTLNRLLATPIKRYEIVLGYLLGYGIFAILQTLLVVTYSKYVLDIQIAGSIWYVFLTNCLIAFVALSLGLLLSTFADSELQMVQFIPVVVVPQIFFAGLLPVDALKEWLQAIAKVMPLYYGGDALKAVMIRGQGMEAIQLDLLILAGIAIVLCVVNVTALKKYRKI
ncbi:ABC transporter permease [Bacillus tianshenii]|uniref:ABC transporter permease n=1 Tax=Sutcliffiella tianshenii TaxID=1463404 RepID=UPI001CD55B0F|nr:ABC transporter permease [Bacillus tianshenii]MCA1321016.1 ABC transporter permease [Bacillus tianshenii]